MPVDSAESRLKLSEQQEQYRALMGPELVVDAGHDLGSSQGTSMHNAYDSQTRLYSATYNNLRVFAQHQFQTADFTSTTGVGTTRCVSKPPVWACNTAASTAPVKSAVSASWMATPCKVALPVSTGR
jgi:hypothetical protein